MFSFCKSQLKFCVFLSVVFCKSVFAIELTIDEHLLEQQIAAVDDLVKLDFTPTALYLLIENEVGEVSYYRAFLTNASFVDGELKNDGGKSDKESFIEPQFVLSFIQSSKVANQDQPLNYSFFFIGADGSFAATPVGQKSLLDLKANNLTSTQLSKAISALSVDVTSARVEYRRIDSEYKLLKEEASKIADIDLLVEMQLNLSEMEDEIDRRTLELERLKQLVADSHRYKENLELDSLRNELSNHLKETAQVTANAHRLNERRKQAAVTGFSKKLALLREVHNVDVQALAQRALSLRKQRRELEMRLNIRPADGYTDF